MKRSVVLGWLLLAAVGAVIVVVVLLPWRPQVPQQAAGAALEIGRPQRPPAVPPPPFGRTDPRQQILYLPPPVRPAPAIDMRKLDQDLRRPR
jgi:hypothetical protein